MANYNTLKTSIADVIKQNGNNEITGPILQQTLLAMVNSLGANYQYAGIATPATNPGTPDQNVFYLASTAGTYPNFGGLVLADGEIAILKYNGAWSKDSTGAASSEKLNQLGQEVNALQLFKNFAIEVIINSLNFEQGSINNSGFNMSSASRVRNVGAITAENKTLSLPDGYVFNEIFYYSSWLSDETFVLNTRIISGNVTYTIDTTLGNYIRFTVRKKDNTEFTPDDLVQNIDSTRQDIENLKGLKYLDDLLVNETLLFEQGTFGVDGHFSPKSNRIRTKHPISNPFELSVQEGWLIYEAYYYTRWNSDSDFTFSHKIVIDSNNAFKFDGQSYVVAFSIRKDDDSTITVDDFIKSNSPIVHKFRSIDDSLSNIDDSLSKSVKTVAQSFNDNDKETARINIGAAKATYETVEESGIAYFGESIADTLATETVNLLSAKNIFDKASFKIGYRLNDSGSEVEDVMEGYTTNYIPALGGLSIISNTTIGKIYYFRQDKTFIARVDGLNANVVGNVNATYNNETIYYIAFQCKSAINADNAIISAVPLGNTPSLPLEYTGFLNTNGTIITPNVFVWKDGFEAFSVLRSSNSSAFPTEIYNPVLFDDITPWEPSIADSGYSNPTSDWGRDTKREDWTATNKYMYYEFLAHYYDIYLGTYNDGEYRVTKRGLWQDGAHTGHEIFEYDFCPKDYRYTVMLSAGLNADETQGIWGLATFIRALMNKEETNMGIMKDNIRFKVIPIINASGFDEATLRYNYSNGVNPNYNFNYKDSWLRHDVPTSQKGDYPDSNYETVMLKQWINEYSGIAVLWLDLHTGRWVVSENTNKIILDIRFSSTSSYFSDFNSVHVPLIKDFYINKGTVTVSDDIGAANSVRDNLDYQKHRYALDICGINSAMPEMHLESTGYGADGFTNNSVDGIKCYVLQIRQIIMYVVNKYIVDKVSTYNLPKLDIMMFRD